MAGYVAGAFALFWRLWADVDRRYLVDGGSDQNQWEWFFAVTARSVARQDDLLFTTLQNHPDGVNLMANTVMLGLSVPLTPVTLTFGAPVTWALVLTFGLAGTAAGWYRFVRRHLNGSRTAAGVAGGFCAFAPPMVSHANAHPNFVVLFVIPFIVGRLVRLARDRRTLRDGAVLGLLGAYQIYIGEEPLLLTAIGVGVFAVAYAVLRPRVAYAVAGRLAGGLGIAVLVFAPLVAYPLHHQFFGRQSYDGLIHGPWGNDLLQLTAFARQSLAGHIAEPGPLAASPTEQNAFFGLPLVVLVAMLLVWLRRLVVVQALAVVIAAAVLLSLGPEIMLNGRPTGWSGPWLWASRLPLLESVVESRLTMICVPAIGLLLALGADRAGSLTAALPPASRRWAGAACCAVLAEALLPISPKPLAAEDRPETPRFITEGTWRRYVGEGRTLVPVPPPNGGESTALRWQVQAGFGFNLPEGYFVGPYGPEREGVYGAPPRPTSILLRRARDHNDVPAVGKTQRAELQADLAYWRADAVVLGPHRRQDVLYETLVLLLGPGRFEDGAWVWDVRPLTRETAR
ncbi:glycosyl transferase [Actinomadura fulvescens]|uniref:Glycosyl transferase n=2 Tax=Actinomadura fulvescens TaxID=46160 RepID=A0ABN3PU30_9ACTN